MSEEQVLVGEYGLTGPLEGALLAGLDEQLLLLTSSYRFLLTTPRQLLDLNSIDMTIADLHPMARDETLCTLASWQDIRQAEQLLMVTTRGFVRAFPLSIMRESIEAPVPLKLDHPLPGLPAAITGASEADEFVLTSAGGRGWRWSVTALRVTGIQVANVDKDDRLSAARIAQPDEEILLLTSNGFSRRLLAGWVPFPKKPNRKGKSLIARRSSIAAIAKANDWVITNKYFYPVNISRNPLVDSTKTIPFLKLERDDSINGILVDPVR